MEGNKEIILIIILVLLLIKIYGQWIKTYLAWTITSGKLILSISNIKEAQEKSILLGELDKLQRDVLKCSWFSIYIKYYKLNYSITKVFKEFNT